MPFFITFRVTMEKISQPFTASKFFITAIGVILIVLALRELQAIVLPFLVAYLLVFIFSPLNDKLRQTGIPNKLLIPANLIIIVVIGFGISRLLIDSGIQLLEKSDAYTVTLNNVVQNTAASAGLKDPELRKFNIKRYLGKFDIKPHLGAAFNSVFSALGAVALTLFFFIFIQSGHHGIVAAIRRSLIRRKMKFNYRGKPEQSAGEEVLRQNDAHTDPSDGGVADAIDTMLKEMTLRIQRYIVSKVAMNSVAGIITGLIALALGLDFPLVWGMLVFILNFIPTIGSAAAFFLISIFALLQTGSWSFFAVTGGIVIGIQTLIFNVLEPVVIGKRIDLNPLVILISVLLWGYIWGVVGMLIAVPLTAIIKIILSVSDTETGKLFTDLMDSRD